MASRNRGDCYRRPNPKNRTHDRRCEICGKYCWPNWRICLQCHREISDAHCVTDDYIGMDGFLYREETSRRGCKGQKLKTKTL